MNEQTRLVLDALIAHPPHALLITGQEGVGLSGIAAEYAKCIGAPVQVVLPEKNETIDLEKGIIGVDIIRRLYEQTKTKTTKARCIVIDYAETMNVQAQNAFLKLLEEPSAHTHFVLLSHNPDVFLPTIRSRAQQLLVRPISDDQSKKLIKDLKVTDITKTAQLLFIAAGLPAELHRLVADESYFASQAAVMRDARTLIQGGSYGGLKVALAYKDNRAGALHCLQVAMRLLRTSLNKENEAQLFAVIERLQTAYGAIRQNGNIRLQISAAVL